MTLPTTGAERVFGDDAARFALAALSGPYLPWGSGTMRPAGLVAVCNDIVLNDRRRIVELGSGISTVLLARLLAQEAPVATAGWPQWSTTPDGDDGSSASWPARPSVTTSRSSTRRLQPRPAAGAAPGTTKPRSTAGLDAAMGGDLIDLLVVDGPPAFADGLGLARHPALPVLRDRLAPDATVVLDDVERPGEQEVLRRWEDEFGLDFRRDRHAGVAIATVP